MPYKNPNRSLVIPQEYLILNDDYILPANIHTNVQVHSPYFHKILAGPLTDNEHSYYRNLVEKSYSDSEIKYIIANFSSTFLFPNQYKYGPITPKHTPPTTDSSFTLITPPSINTPPVVTVQSIN